MQKFNMIFTSRWAVLIGGVVLGLGMAWPLMGTAQDKSDAAKDSNQHSQHKHPAGDADLAGQIAELHAKVAKLEAALNRYQKDPESSTPDKGGASGAQDKSGGDAPSDRASAKFQNCLECHRTRPSGPLPPSHLDEAGSSDKGTKQGGMAAMGDKKKPAGGKGTGMGKKSGKAMGKDMDAMGGGDEMDGMDTMDMDEMKGMGGIGGGASAESAEMKMMGMMMSMMEKMMGGMGGGSMQPGQAAPAMGGGEMGMKMDKMMGMMDKMMGGMGGGSMQPGQGTSAASGMGAMGGGAAPVSSEMKMMEKMMSLMEKMIGGMGGGSMQPGQVAPAMGGMPMM